MNDDEIETILKETVIAQLRDYPYSGICLEELGKTIKSSVRTTRTQLRFELRTSETSLKHYI
jgi:hypothetical protein